MIKPLNNRILIRLGAEPEGADYNSLQGKIITPEAAIKKFTRMGTVVAVGPLDESGLKAGDEVLCFHTVGTAIERDGDEFVLLMAEHVAGVTTKTA